MMAKETLGHDSNGVGATHHPCAAPVWRLPVGGARCRTPSRCPSRLLSTLGGALLTRTTATSLVFCAREPPHVAKKSPFPRARPSTGTPDNRWAYCSQRSHASA